MKSNNTRRSGAKTGKVARRKTAGATGGTVSMTLAEAEARAARGETQTDWAAVDALTDAEIARAVAKDPDAPALLDDTFWRSAQLLVRAAEAPKTTITIRIDRDVLAALKHLGPGYQSRINAVLRAYVERKAS